MVSSHGRFVWYELTTTDMPSRPGFYSVVVGWGARDASMPGMPYTVLRRRSPGRRMMNLPKDAAKIGASAELDRICRGRRRGRHRRPPQAILAARCMSSRRISSTSAAFRSLSDPQMATLALIQAAEAPARSSPLLCALMAISAGTSCSRPTGRGRGLSTASFLAGKKRRPTKTDGDVSGVLRRRPDDRRNVYQACRWCRSTLALLLQCRRHRCGSEARERHGGGRILSGPMEVPGGNWIIRCMDPQGAMFALVGNIGIGFFGPAVAAPSRSQRGL